MTVPGKAIDPAACFVPHVPCKALLTELAKLFVELQQPSGQNLQGPASICWKPIFLCESCILKFDQIGDVRIGERTELCQMRPQGVRRHGSLADEKRSGSMRYENTLLLDHLHRNDTHRRTLVRLADCLHIQSVALSSFVTWYGGISRTPCPNSVSVRAQ